MYILGILQIIIAVLGIANALYWITSPLDNTVGSFIYGGIQILLVIPYWIGGFYYLSFFVKKNSDPDRKLKLPRAHLLNIISILLQCIWGIAGGYIFYSGPINSESFMFGNTAGFQSSETVALLTNIFGTLAWCALNHYWLIVTRRFATGDSQNYQGVVMQE